jgi:hypothetical protein
VKEEDAHIITHRIQPSHTFPGRKPDALSANPRAVNQGELLQSPTPPLFLSAIVIRCATPITTRNNTSPTNLPAVFSGLFLSYHL